MMRHDDPIALAQSRDRLNEDYLTYFKESDRGSAEYPKLRSGIIGYHSSIAVRNRQVQALADIVEWHKQTAEKRRKSHARFYTDKLEIADNGVDFNVSATVQDAVSLADVKLIHRDADGNPRSERFFLETPAHVKEFDIAYLWCQPDFVLCIKGQFDSGGFRYLPFFEMYASRNYYNWKWDRSMMHDRRALIPKAKILQCFRYADMKNMSKETRRVVYKMLKMSMELICPVRLNTLKRGLFKEVNDHLKFWKENQSVTCNRGIFTKLTKLMTDHDATTECLPELKPILKYARREEQTITERLEQLRQLIIPSQLTAYTENHCDLTDFNEIEYGGDALAIVGDLDCDLFDEIEDTSTVNRLPIGYTLANFEADHKDYLQHILVGFYGSRIGWRVTLFTLREFMECLCVILIDNETNPTDVAWDHSVFSDMFAVNGPDFINAMPTTSKTHAMHTLATAVFNSKLSAYSRDRANARRLARSNFPSLTAAADSKEDDANEDDDGGSKDEVDDGESSDNSNEDDDNDVDQADDLGDDAIADAALYNFEDVSKNTDVDSIIYDNTSESAPVDSIN